MAKQLLVGGVWMGPGSVGLGPTIVRDGAEDDSPNEEMTLLARRGVE